MSPTRFKVIAQPSDTDDNTFVVILEVVGFPDRPQADAFGAQLTQWVTDTDNHDGR